MPFIPICPRVLRLSTTGSIKPQRRLRSRCRPLIGAVVITLLTLGWCLSPHRATAAQAGTDPTNTDVDRSATDSTRSVVEAGGLADTTPLALSPDAPATTWTAEDLEAALGGGTFGERQRATLELWRDRDTSRDAVLRATRASDPEVASRARWILDRWRHGILFETPTSLVRQLESANEGDSVEQLLDQGWFAGARVATEEAIDADDQTTLVRVTAVVTRGFPFYVRLADSQDQLDEFAELIDRLATTTEMIECRNRLWERLDKGAPIIELPADRVASDEDRQRIAVLNLTILGREEEAISLARESGDPELLRVCQLLGKHWSELALSQVAEARAAVPGSDIADRHWAYTLIAADRSGDTELRREAIAALSHRDDDHRSDAAIDDPFVSLRWRVLAMHGEIDRAVEILLPDQPFVAAELLFQAGRAAEAFEAVGFDTDQTDGQIAEIIAAAQAVVVNLADIRSGEPPPTLGRALTIARLLYQTGRRDAAWEIFRGLVLSPVEGDDQAKRFSWLFSLQALMRLNRSDWLAEIYVSGEGGPTAGNTQAYLARAFGVEPETLASVGIGLAQVLSLEGPDLLAAVVDFVAGKRPLGFDPQTDYRELVAVLSGEATGPSLNSTRRRAARPLDARRLDQRPVVRLSLDIVRLLEAHGEVALAKRTLVKLASFGELEAILEYAQSELNGGRAATARDAFASIWNRSERNRRVDSRLSRSEDDASVALRAIVGEAIAAARSGDDEGSERLWRLIDLMACSPSVKLRDSLANWLVEQGYHDRGEAIYRDLLPLVAFGAGEEDGFYSVVSNYRRSVDQRDPELEADLLDLAVVGTIESASFFPAAYVALPSVVHRKRVYAAIAQGDLEAIFKHRDALLRLNPVDIDFAEKAIGKLRDAGFSEVAESTIEAIYRSGDEYLKRFPLDIVTANNLAWVLALSDHRLDEAFELSRTAVHFAPDSTVYRDTLAEVLHRLGRTDEAIEVAELCLLDDPGEWHVHEQLKRFRDR